MHDAFNFDENTRFDELSPLEKLYLVLLCHYLYVGTCRILARVLFKGDIDA